MFYKLRLDLILKSCIRRGYNSFFIGITRVILGRFLYLFKVLTRLKLKTKRGDRVGWAGDTTGMKKLHQIAFV